MHLPHPNPNPAAPMHPSDPEQTLEHRPDTCGAKQHLIIRSGLSEPVLNLFFLKNRSHVRQMAIGCWGDAAAGQYRPRLPWVWLGNILLCSVCSVIVLHRWEWALIRNYSDPHPYSILTDLFWVQWEMKCVIGRKHVVHVKIEWTERALKKLGVQVPWTSIRALLWQQTQCRTMTL